MMADLQELMEDFKIILKHSPETELIPQHDQIFCGVYKGTPLIDKVYLERRGWFEEYDAWSHFC
jgi:hypothetical protein